MFEKFSNDVNAKLSFWGYTKATEENLRNVYKFGFCAHNSAIFLREREWVRKL